MACETGTETSNLEHDLLNNSTAYDYFQAVRMIGLLGRQLTKNENETSSVKLNVRPELSFDYPSSDISNIHVVDGENGKEYSINTTFMGLYGVSSPLPAYFTEELLDDEWNDIKAPREFLDVIHQHLYPLLYKAWLKYKFSHNAIEHKDINYWNLLFSLIGIGTEEVKSAVIQPERLIRYTGLLAQQSRSAVGLQTVLQDYLSDYQINIEPCVLRSVPIPASQRLMLGSKNCILGDSVVLGSSIMDRTGKFVIRIGPLDEKKLDYLKKNINVLEFVKFIIKSYLMQPLEYDLILSLAPRTAKGVSLGVNEWSSLGRDSWLGMQETEDTVEMLVD